MKTRLKTEMPAVVAPTTTAGGADTNAGAPMSIPIVAQPEYTPVYTLGEIIDILAELGAIVQSERAAVDPQPGGEGRNDDQEA